mmetsp:Transcript_36330/g.61236  ORF Transcript_36330/g.61236 Transcript_36330/m.61236 type:complete len:371 (+) Transcript_36330:344-1456(+)
MWCLRHWEEVGGSVRHAVLVPAAYIQPSVPHCHGVLVSRQRLLTLYRDLDVHLVPDAAGETRQRGLVHTKAEKLPKAALLGEIASAVDVHELGVRPRGVRIPGGECDREAVVLAHELWRQPRAEFLHRHALRLWAHFASEQLVGEPALRPVPSEHKHVLGALHDRCRVPEARTHGRGAVQHQRPLARGQVERPDVVENLFPAAPTRNNHPVAMQRGGMVKPRGRRHWPTRAGVLPHLRCEVKQPHVAERVRRPFSAEHHHGILPHQRGVRIPRRWNVAQVVAHVLRVAVRGDDLGPCAVEVHGKVTVHGHGSGGGVGGHKAEDADLVPEGVRVLKHGVWGVVHAKPTAQQQLVHPHGARLVLHPLAVNRH